MQNATAPKSPRPRRPGAGGDVAASALLQNYRPLPGIHDEMMLPSGELRPPWRVFGDLLAQCNAQDIQARHKTAQHLLHDHGVTYNIFDDAIGTSRPWSLDLIPHIVAATEAEQVAQGHRPTGAPAGYHPAGSLRSAADHQGGLAAIRTGARQPRLSAPSRGTGTARWALPPRDGLRPCAHGRRCLARAGGSHPGAWRPRLCAGKPHHSFERLSRGVQCLRVQRLAAYFDVERETFRSLAPGRRAAPTIVMLTPGPRDETYFEHAFKARYLGFPLAMSADLTVRDRRVHLKTLEGLRRVDVVVAAGSMTCTAIRWKCIRGRWARHPWPDRGLAQWQRRALQRPRHRVGRDTRLASIFAGPLPSSARGTPASSLRADLVVRPAAAAEHGPGRPAEVGAEGGLRPRGARSDLSRQRSMKAARAAALERLKARTASLGRPRTAAPLHHPDLDGRPSRADDRLFGGTFSLHRGGSYTTMPGGLSRVSPNMPTVRVVTMRSGGISKDTWVLSDGPVNRPPPHSKPTHHHPASPSTQRRAQPRGGSPLLAWTLCGTAWSRRSGSSARR
jgi:hypothetical protein